MIFANLNFEEQIPTLRKTEGFITGNFEHHIPWAKKTQWKDANSQIAAQYYDARDGYVNLLQFILKKPIELNVTTTVADLFLSYILRGTIIILNEDGTPFLFEGIGKLTKDEYTLLYSSPRTFKLVLGIGTHTIFFFMLSKDWLYRYAHNDGVKFQELSHRLYHQHNTFYCSKIMTIKSPIRKHILFLIGIPPPHHEDETLDAKIYKPLTDLLRIARHDLEDKKIPVKETKDEILKEIHDYIVEQTKEGDVLLTANEIADFFDMSLQHLNRLYNEKYGYTVYQDVMIERVKKTQRIVMQSYSHISDTWIARKVGYSDSNQMVAQYKKYFGHHPREDRPDYIPPLKA